ncbi:MAG TPA: hypothetical protein DC049_07655 [Spirochaetia bacterium]|nr:hypothetical protein [Spirochaetia bacterium]
MEFLSGKNIYIFLLLLFTIFFLWGYLCKEIFYTAYCGGSFGDNYWFIRETLNNPDYIWLPHLYFPLIPGKIFQFITAIAPNMEWLKSPEKIFIWFSYSTKILVLIGLIFAWKILYTGNLTRLQALLGIFFIAVSFAYWLWGIQPNARGVMLALIFISIYFTVLALKKKKIIHIMISSIISCLVVYVHIGGLFFTLGIFLVHVLWLFFDRREKKYFIQIAVLSATYLICGALFYFLAAWHYHTWSFARLFAEIANTEQLGVFNLHHSFFKLLFRDGISSNLAMLIGPQYDGVPRTFTSLAAISLALGCILSLFISFISIRWKLFFNSPAAPVFFTSLFCFIVTMIGFSIRKTFIAYYGPVIVFTSILLFLLAFAPRRNNAEYPNFLILLLMSFSMFFLNGHGDVRVFWGEQRITKDIFQKISMLKIFPGEHRVNCYHTKIESWGDEMIVRYYTEIPERYSGYSSIAFKPHYSNNRELYQQIRVNTNEFHLLDLQYSEPDKIISITNDLPDDIRVIHRQSLLLPYIIYLQLEKHTNVPGEKFH